MISIKDVLFMDTLEKEKVAQQKYIDEFGCAVLSTLVDGHHGIHIPEIFLDMLGEKASDCEPEWVDERVNEVMLVASDELGEAMEDEEYTIGWNGADGSICIFYGTCEEDL